jgi:hypothetical protein
MIWEVSDDPCEEILGFALIDNDNPRKLREFLLIIRPKQLQFRPPVREFR